MQITHNELRRHLRDMNINERDIPDDQLDQLAQDVEQRLQQDQLDFQPRRPSSSKPADYYTQRPIKVETSNYAKKKPFQPIIEDGDEPRFKDQNPDDQIFSQLKQANAERDRYMKEQQMLEDQLQQQQNEFNKLHPENAPKLPDPLPEVPDEPNLDKLAEEIVQAKVYKRAKTSEPMDMERIIRTQTEVQKTLKNPQQSQNSQTSQVQNSQVQNSQLQTSQSNQNQLDQSMRSQTSNYSAVPNFNQSLNTSTINKLNANARIISHQLPPQMFSKQQLIDKRADKVDRWNYYQKVWNVQGAPQDRAKRILNNKAEKLLRVAKERIEGEREREYQEYLEWRGQQQRDEVLDVMEEQK